jgi:hypothetical protein
MHLLLENVSKEDLKKYLKEFYNYAKKELQLDRSPRLFLKEDKENAEDMFGKTGFYDPENEEIHLFISDRHAKDILRSFSHELVHHAQKLDGLTDKLDLSKTTNPAYASEDEGLREMERDAFERGNMIFRDWCDGKKLERKNIMAEEKKLPKSVIVKGHKIAKKIAKNDAGVNPYAVGMAAAKKQAGIKQEIEMPELSELENKEDADLDNDGKLSPYEKKRGEAIEKSIKKQAQKHAKENMDAVLGKDMKKENEQENLSENDNHPYPELLKKKERLMQDMYNKREDAVYQELIRRFIKK